MGHIAIKEEYGRLQRRLEGAAVAAVESAVLYDILSMLFSPEEASIAARMPYGFASTGRLARMLKIPADDLAPRLTAMAAKGLVFDIERKGRSYWFLNPLVIGFFEFTMMRVRPALDQKTVAHKMWEYMFEDPNLAFIRELTRGETQLFRPLAHEHVLNENVVEVLDYDRASHMVESANAWTVGLCHCRHVAHHRGRDCKVEQMESCISIGTAAQYFARHGMGRAISKSECLDIVVEARGRGLVQLGDNVKQRGLFICNCCNCCCEVLESLRRLRPSVALLTSNYVARMNADTCTHCGACAKACPVEAFLVLRNGKARQVSLNDSACIGCGVCVSKCKSSSLGLVNRPARVHTPETTVEKLVLMAIERGKLQNLLLDDPAAVSHKVLRSFISAIVRLPPAKQALARKQVRSAFVRRFLNLATHRPGTDI
jgi:ferredoxin